MPNAHAGRFPPQAGFKPSEGGCALCCYVNALILPLIIVESRMVLPEAGDSDKMKRREWHVVDANPLILCRTFNLAK